MAKKPDKPKKKNKKKEARKDSTLILRLEKSERDAFVDLCKSRETTAAREIRKFIRRYSKKHRVA